MAQQPLFSVQHSWPFSQQPSLASATQQADGVLQQASFWSQQLALAATVFTEQHAAAVVATVFVAGPQQAFASLQQAMPSVQHFCTAAQQPLFSAQHFWPFSQQPSLASATQHALWGLQQASLAVQQSLACSSAEANPASMAPRTANEPTSSFANMEKLL
jgi:hypothetical protein